MVVTDAVNPAALGRPSGYSNGVRAGNLLFVSGQIGATVDAKGKTKIVSPKFAEQFERGLLNVLAVVKEAGADATGIVELTIFVTDLKAYARARPALRDAWLRTMGKRYPAVTLVEVSGLLEKGAVVEIRAIAALG